MGGATFPTHVKLSPPSPIDHVLVNGCESEPYLTCDHRVLVEHRDEVECGMQLAMQAVGATRGTIIAEDNHYLDGYERRLIQKALGRRVPHRGKPSDVGVLVINVQTVRALHQAVCQNRPLVDRVITVDGDAVRRPGNYVVPLGTPVSHILKACGVDPRRASAVIAGGPMMGAAVGPQTAVTGGTGGVLALGAHQIAWSGQDPCIQCGQCLEVCPLALPAGLLVRRPNPTVLQCIECGLCQFACPARRALLPALRKAKQGVTDSIKRTRCKPI
jgi:electron transport complex protein RnfC